MTIFDSDRYGPVAKRFLANDRLPDLGPGSPEREQRDALNRLDIDVLFAGRPLADRDMAQCCIAALWLRYDFLDESHVISQSIGSATGSYWHGILHRREPDYSNAKYWFRRVGEHEIFPELCQHSCELAREEGKNLDANSRHLTNQDTWDPPAFVDLCQAVARGKSEAEHLARAIAQAEWQLLFDFCFQQALLG